MKWKKNEEQRRQELFDAWFNNPRMTCFLFAPYEAAGAVAALARGRQGGEKDE